jgi:membrane protease YdiL (CAAX protease family)
MEIYDQGTQKSQKTKNSGPEEGKPRSFFPHSEMNDWTPLWEKLCFFLLGFFGLDLLSTASVSVIRLTPLAQTDAVAASAVNMFVAYFLLAGAFVLFIFLDGRKTYRRVAVGFTHSADYAYVGIGFLVMIIINYVFSFLYSNFVPFYGANSNQVGVEDYIKALPVLSFFPIVLFAPFCEELTYRIGLVDSIGHKNRWLGIVLASIVFGLIHFDFSAILSYSEGLQAYEANTITADQLLILKEDLLNEFLNLPVYILNGVVLAFVYAKSGDISTSMTLHLSNNLFSYIEIIISLFLPTAADSTSNASSLLSLFGRMIR